MSEKDTPLEWVGTSLDDLSAFPLKCKKEIGLAIRTAQKGGKAQNAAPMKGFGGASVLEIWSDFDGDTFRAIYTVKFKGVIYVLHAFQKKSNQGNKTSLNDMNKIKARLKTAKELFEEREDEQSKKHKKPR
jgi:phage-related protein